MTRQKAIEYAETFERGEASAFETGGVKFLCIEGNVVGSGPSWDDAALDMECTLNSARYSD